MTLLKMQITGEVLLDGESIYGDMDINLCGNVGNVFQKPILSIVFMTRFSGLVPTASIKDQAG